MLHALAVQELHQGLWGPFYYSPKRKAVLPIKPEQAHKLTPLFVQVRLVQSPEPL